jgi:gliding motility-associated lipoprotein GldH
MKRISQIMTLLFVAIVVSFCDSSVVYEQQKDLEERVWHKDSVLSYSFEADSIFSEAIKFSFNVRHNISYAYKNMWLFVNIQTPNRSAIIDTINLEFMDNAGNWLPHVTGGTIKESRHYYRYALPNPQKGLYKILLQQGMREDKLDNVVSVGARIEKIASE